MLIFNSVVLEEGWYYMRLPDQISANPKLYLNSKKEFVEMTKENEPLIIKFYLFPDINEGENDYKKNQDFRKQGVDAERVKFGLKGSCGKKTVEFIMNSKNKLIVNTLKETTEAKIPKGIWKITNEVIQEKTTNGLRGLYTVDNTVDNLKTWIWFAVIEEVGYFFQQKKNIWKLQENLKDYPFDVSKNDYKYNSGAFF